MCHKLNRHASAAVRQPLTLKAAQAWSAKFSCRGQEFGTQGCGQNKNTLCALLLSLNWLRNQAAAPQQPMLQHPSLAASTRKHTYTQACASPHMHAHTHTHIPTKVECSTNFGSSLQFDTDQTTRVLSRHAQPWEPSPLNITWCRITVCWLGLCWTASAPHRSEDSEQKAKDSWTVARTAARRVFPGALGTETEEPRS